MSVFIVFDGEDYECEVCIGLFSSYDNAYKFINQNYNLKQYEEIRPSFWKYKNSYILVEERQIDELLK